MAWHSNLKVLPQIEGGHRDYSGLVSFAGGPGALILGKARECKGKNTSGMST